MISVLFYYINDHLLIRIFCRHSLAEAMQWVDDILAKSPFIGIILIITIGIILIKGTVSSRVSTRFILLFSAQLLSRPLPVDMFHKKHKLPHLPPHFVLFLSQDRRHLFVTPVTIVTTIDSDESISCLTKEQRLEISWNWIFFIYV